MFSIIMDRISRIRIIDVDLWYRCCT